MAIYTHKTTIRISDEHFVISKDNVEEEALDLNLNTSQLVVKFSDIKSFRYESPNNKLKAIKFNTHTNKKINLTFLLALNKKEGIAPDEIFTKFLEKIALYNTGETQNKIRLLPTFVATIWGQICIYMLIIGYIFVVVLSIIHFNKRKEIPTLLLPLGIILQLIAQRQTDKRNFQENQKQLDLFEARFK